MQRDLSSKGRAARALKAGETFTTAPDPQTRQNLSGKKRAGLFAAIAGAVALVAIVLASRDEEEMPDFGGCVLVLSPGADSGC